MTDRYPAFQFSLSKPPKLLNNSEQVAGVRGLTVRLLETRVATAHCNAPAPSECLTDSCGRNRAVAEQMDQYGLAQELGGRFGMAISSVHLL